MIYFYSLPLLIISAGVAFWTVRNSERRLQNPESLIGLLFPAECDGFDEHLSPLTIDLFIRDEDLFVGAGGWSGLARKKHNAKIFVRVAQTLAANLTSPRDNRQDELDNIEFMLIRAQFINFLTWCAYPEALCRFFIPGLPHYCAQFIYQLYWQAELRLQSICAEIRPDLLGALHSML